MKKILLLLFLLIPRVCSAQLTEKVNRHFIIAVDAVPASPYAQVLRSTNSRETIEKVLTYFELTDKDRVSFVSFAINLSNPNFDSFAYIPNGVKGQLSWTKMDNADLSKWGNWDDIAFFQHHREIGGSYNRASFLSGSKPYIMHRVHATDRVGANETILLMLSDQDVNSLGNRWEDEWRDMSQVPDSHIAPHFQEVQTFIKSVNDVLYFNEIKIDNRDYYILRSGYSKNGKNLPYTIKAYKLKIVPKPLQAIATIPTPLPIKRVRGGYKLSLDIVSNDSCYSIEKIELETGRTGKRYIIKSGLSTLDITKSDFVEGDNVILRAWVRYKDGIYNGTVMNPYDPQYKGALTIPQTIKWCEDTRILGMIPLCDLFWWFFPNNIQMAVMTWNLIIILIFIMFVCYVAFSIFRSITRYIPNNNDISIVKI